MQIICEILQWLSCGTAENIARYTCLLNDVQLAMDAAESCPQPGQVQEPEVFHPVVTEASPEPDDDSPCSDGVNFIQGMS